MQAEVSGIPTQGLLYLLLRVPGGCGGGCRGSSGLLPCAARAPVLFAGGARAQAHPDRVRPAGRGDPAAAGGHQQHTRESSRAGRDQGALGSWSPASGIEVHEGVNWGYLRGAVAAARGFLCLAAKLSQADLPFPSRSIIFAVSTNLWNLRPTTMLSATSSCWIYRSSWAGKTRDCFYFSEGY